MSIRKIIYIAIALVVAGLFAKQLTFTRAIQFASECLSAEERDLIQSRKARSLAEEDQRTLTENTFSCIKTKQTTVEKMITQTTGYFWIN